MLVMLIFISGLAISSFIINLLIKLYLVRLIRRIFRAANSPWAETFIHYKVIQRIAHIAPGIFLSFMLTSFDQTDILGLKWVNTIKLMASLYLLGAITLALNAALSAGTEIYETYKISIRSPIRPYTQVLKLIILLISSILVISMLLGKDPSILFTGLGATIVAVMFVFKDSILGFAASIQLAIYDMVRIGDWITVPSFNADGDVEEISLNTVKVRNFDKTVSTIPTAALLTHGVKNWRGMQELGGRRIKRFILIDISTIKFCTKQMLERFSQVDLLIKILTENKGNVIKYSKLYNENDAAEINKNEMTNVGIYRTYINEYLKKNELIHKSRFTFIVRQLQPNESGLPIEIYVFTKDTEWKNYENIQADIFDHLLASLAFFKLRAFQNDSGFNRSILMEPKKLL